MSREITSIHLTPETRDRLRSRKEGNETYDELLTRVLDRLDALESLVDEEADE